MGSSQSTVASLPQPQAYEEGTEYAPPTGAHTHTHGKGKEKEKKRLSRVDLRGPLRAAFGRSDGARSRDPSRVRGAGGTGSAESQSLELAHKQQQQQQSAASSSATSTTSNTAATQSSAYSQATTTSTTATASHQTSAPLAPPKHPLAQQISSRQLQEESERKDKDREAKETPQKASMPPSTVPCQYRTGKTLGSGTYAIVKEAIHVETGKYYACKVINKRLMEGREHMVRNEIAVLKRVSKGHQNVVTLHDYFETAHNLYLCFDLCTGGELFDRICAKGNYYEADARALIRTIFKAVKYIHESGIVHRDLKPENLLFRTQAEDADIMIADFGLSRIMDENKHTQLTEICGTPGYMAPEIFQKTGHGRPVDVWAMGVITYFLLAGYTPFDRDSQQAEMEAIVRGDYSFTPVEYWANVSDVAKDFVRTCLTVDQHKRPTAAEALEHKWLKMDEDYFVPDPDREGAPKDLLPNVKRAFDAKQLWRKAASTIKAVNRMTLLAHPEAGSLQELRANVDQYKEESALETLESATVTYAADGSENGDDPDEGRVNAKEDGRPPPPDKESVIMPPPKAN